MSKTKKNVLKTDHTLITLTEDKKYILRYSKDNNGKFYEYMDCIYNVSAEDLAILSQELNEFIANGYCGKKKETQCKKNRFTDIEI